MRSLYFPLHCIYVGQILITSAHIFEHKSDFDGHNCFSSGLISSLNVRNAIDCVYQCNLVSLKTSEFCGGVFYLNASGATTCQLCNQTYDTGHVAQLPTLTGSVYYRSEYDLVIDQSAYILTKTRQSFSDGVAICEGLGAYAATVDSARESARIRELARTRFEDNYVFGLWQPTDTDWIWIETGNVTTFDDFHPNEPDGGSAQNCAALHKTFDFLWIDTICSLEYPMICELPFNR